MFLVGVSLGRAGAGGDRACGAVRGADQALHSVEQVSYIIDIVRMTDIFVVKNNEKFLFFNTLESTK